MSECPVCRAEYQEGKANSCTNCGWDLAPMPPSLQMPEIFVQKERTKLTWANSIWKKLQVQEKLAQIEVALQGASKERSHLQTQLTQLAAQVEQLRQRQINVSSPPASANGELPAPEKTILRTRICAFLRILAYVALGFDLLIIAIWVFG